MMLGGSGMRAVPMIELMNTVLEEIRVAKEPSGTGPDPVMRSGPA
jgi:hypothetical protein